MAIRHPGILVTENCDITIDEALHFRLAAEGIDVKRSNAWRSCLSHGSEARYAEPDSQLRRPNRTCFLLHCHDEREPLGRNEQPGADCRTAGLSSPRPGRGRTWPGVMAGHRAANGSMTANSSLGHWKYNHVHCGPASRSDHRALVNDGSINGASYLECLQQTQVPILIREQHRKSSFNLPSRTRKPDVHEAIKAVVISARSTCLQYQGAISFPAEEVCAKSKAILSTLRFQYRR